MGYRPLDITVISAEDLKDVNRISKMDVYVEVSIGGDPVGKQTTHVDKDGGKSPNWNHRLMFHVSDLAANSAFPILFKIRSDRLLGDKDIGDVSVPIKELLLEADGGERVVVYQVRTPSGEPKGTLKFSYKFGDRLAAPAVPPPPSPKSKNTGGEAPSHPGPDAAYPLPAHVGYAQPQPGYGYPPPQPGYGYPPPQPGYGAPSLTPGYGYPAPGYGYPPVQPGYGAPPPAPGYGAPPPAPGYGYPPVQEAVHKPTKKINFGLALAAAGLLEGVLMGDMAGLGDAGFDF